MASPKILAFGGTTREASWTKKLAYVAAEYARAAGGEVAFADLRDYPMPLFDQDLEAESGKPAAAKQWKQLMVEHDGFIVATAEYNRSLPAVLKNAIDWASRADDDDPGPAPAFRGKTVALMSSSPGPVGGLRAMYHAREIFDHMGCYILPRQIVVPKVQSVFNDDGTMGDDATATKIEAFAAEFVAFTKKLVVA